MLRYIAFCHIIIVYVLTINIPKPPNLHKNSETFEKKNLEKTKKISSGYKTGLKIIKRTFLRKNIFCHLYLTFVYLSFLRQ